VLLRLSVVLNLLLALCLPTPSNARSAPQVFHGTVVDAANGQPLKGAAVVFVWYKVPRVYMDKIGYFCTAVEVLTDEQGQFSVSNSPKCGWSLWTYVDKEWPYFVVFKPSYADHSPSKIR